jgi:shikimate kinase
MDNVILIGFMGTGKTEVGKILANELGFGYLDTDSLIEAQQGRTINNIFDNLGEAAFRDMETALLGKLGNEKHKVISTGGGIILRSENVVKLKKLGAIVLLWAEADAIYKRLEGNTDRPLLQVTDPKAKIQEILGVRTPVYKKAADFQVDTTKISPQEVCDNILVFLKGRK